MTAVELKLEHCRYCCGTRTDPTKSSGAECPACDGGGYQAVWGDLGQTRTYKTRPFHYNPGTGSLSVVRDKKRTDYTVTEFAPDQTPGEAPTRAFAVVKLNRCGLPIERYNVEVGKPGFHKCSCTGFLAEATERGNKTAWKAGEPIVYETWGCIHLDFCLRAVWDGLFDITKELPCKSSQS